MIPQGEFQLVVWNPPPIISELRSKPFRRSLSGSTRSRGPISYSRHPSGRQEVSGRLINQSDRSLRNAQVQIALYDEYNRPIDRLMVVVRGVAPGNDMAFRQTVDNEQAVGAKVRSIMTQ